MFSGGESGSCDISQHENCGDFDFYVVDVWN